MAVRPPAFLLAMLPLLALAAPAARTSAARHHGPVPPASGASVQAGEDPGELDQGDGSDQDTPEQDQADAPPAVPEKYVVGIGSKRALAWKPPKLPDLAPYTEAAAMARLHCTRGASVHVGSMLGELSFKTFMSADGRLREWALRQASMPQVIFISGGCVTPKQLAHMLPARYFAETAPGVFIARLPIDVRPGATLDIGRGVKDFRLSLQRGAFLVNEGNLFVTYSRVEGWNEAGRQPAWFKDEKDFRPYIISWGGSQTYIIKSVVAHLGYAASKAYGVSLSQFSPSLEPLLKRKPPGGWLLDSEFFDNWYGFYCYEAQGVVIRGNIYHDNIKYGIDPHDRSRYLVIAENTVYNTKIKHGIIVSRQVDDSWIFGNRSFDNNLSGIVVDRSSVDNVIAFNKTYRNHSDGITVYESSSTVIWRNLVLGNDRHGIRVRNSLDVQVRDNVVVGNTLSGIYGHIENLADTGRNLQLDPFHPEVSMIVVGGKIVSNGSGPIGIDQPLSLEIYDVDLRQPRRSLGIQMSGVLGEYQQQVLDILVRRQLPVLIKPATQQALTSAARG